MIFGINTTTNHAITYTNSKWQPQFLRNIPRGKRVKYPVQEKKRVSSKRQSQVNWVLGKESKILPSVHTRPLEAAIILASGTEGSTVLQ